MITNIMDTLLVQSIFLQIFVCVSFFLSTYRKDWSDFGIAYRLNFILSFPLRKTACTVCISGLIRTTSHDLAWLTSYFLLRVFK